MECLDSRRLTGPNLHLPGAGVIAEVSFAEGEDPQSFCEHWQALVLEGLKAFGLQSETCFARIRAGWASVGFSGPIDRLYAAVELNEWAVMTAIAQLTHTVGQGLSDVRATLAAQFEAECNPTLLALQQMAQTHGVPFLWDDDEVSIGYGAHAQVWPADDLPQPDDVVWNTTPPLPIVLVTGTNGKTTTSRILTRILQTAGHSVGSTSSDGVCVGEQFIESGDWTGPGAARMVMRRDDIDAAVLETARGGLLRRGIGVNACDVAIITNVSEDHLGDYGIRTTSEMAEVKAMITTVVKPTGARVLNADDAHLTSLAHQGGGRLIWFAEHADNPRIHALCADGGEAWFLADGQLCQQVGTHTEAVVAVSDIPCTLRGAARYNAMNALAAAAGASALGVSKAKIATALKTFGRDFGDNPGRCERFRLKTFDLIIDFAHNPASVQATLHLARELMRQGDYRRLCVTIGQAGDRDDEAIQALTRAVFEAQPDHVIVRNVAGYERGRASGEIPEMMRTFLQGFGQPAQQIQRCDTEVETLEHALTWSQPGDLVVHLIHIEREAVQTWLSNNESEIWEPITQ